VKPSLSNLGPICFVSLTPPCRTSIQDAVEGCGFADCSQGVLVKAMGSKDAQRIQRLSTAREDLIYTIVTFSLADIHTPRIFRASTRSIPTGGCMGPHILPLPTTIISLDLQVLSLRLLVSAHC